MKTVISNKYVISGTFGDAFIAFCKLYKLRGEGFNDNIKLIHLSAHPEVRPFINKLFNLLDNVVIEEFIFVKSGKEVEEFINHSKLPSINSLAINNKSVVTDEIRDPEYLTMEPYPNINIEPRVVNNNFKIGIQLHSGKKGSNFKGFSLSWLEELLNLTNKNNCEIYLLGTGAGYSINKINSLCNSLNISNLIGKTDYEDWLSYIMSMNFFITGEGFSAFFAMSQKVKSLIFYSDYQIIGRIHPLWKKENIILSAGWETFEEKIKNKFCRHFLNRNQLLRPLKPSQVWSLIYTYYLSE
ncbi:MAG: hypothetical protein C4560_08665 [Nitrospiraceae bacterium]|nr:MAG: hypothetical protein C4560_08665 [Nitrospiraceae bacterium]